MTTEIVENYLEAAKRQAELARGIRMEVDIDAKLVSMKKHGRLQALRHISKIGRISYIVRSFVGDNTVKKDVIARYLTAETQASEKSGEIGITPENYKFKYKKELETEGRRVYVLEVTPKKKKVGLFKGELWIDTETYLPVRETGRLVKNPSILLKKVEFVREYDIQDGVSLPRHILSKLDTRVFGKAELDITYSAFSREEATDEAPLAPIAGAASAAMMPR